MSNVIQFERGRVITRPQLPPPQPNVVTGKLLFHGNQHTRRSFIAMFLVGASVRKLGKEHPAGERGIEQDIREALLGDGPAVGRAA